VKIALIGSAPSSVALGPYHDQSYGQFIQAKPPSAYPPAIYVEQRWDIWVCSPGAFGIVPRANRWFEVHRWEPGKTWFSPEYCQYLREFNGPVYTGGPIPEIKNHVIYPYREVEAEFSSYFLTSSLALMAAEAILTIQKIRNLRALAKAGQRAAAECGLAALRVDAAELDQADEDDIIGYWGVDMSADEEYSRQKPGCWFFILEALRRGIGTYAPPESDLLNPEAPYGISEWDVDYIKLASRMKEANDRITRAAQQIEAATREHHAAGGMRAQLAHMIKTHLNRDRIPAGMVVRINPGEGLGCRMDSINGFQIESVKQAAYGDARHMTPPPVGPEEAPGT
jgi:hypothetical protein